MDFCISCALGLESILKKEIQLAWYMVTDNKPKLISFTGDLFAIAKINLRSRVGNKVYLRLEKMKITTFDALFEMITNINRSEYILKQSPIIITASSKNSQLSSTPAIQSIVKKAIIKKLLDGKEDKREENKGMRWIEIHIHFEDNDCSLLLNTTGESLHKRWYRQTTGIAPINESLAAGLILLSWWKFHEPLYDICCWSGTIAIEAAMIAKNIAPGLLRTFAFEDFRRYDKTLLERAKKEAEEKKITHKEHRIIASDNDVAIIEVAKQNANKARVGEYITFETKEIKEYSDESLTWSIVSNPPYGKRLTGEDIDSTYKTIENIFLHNPKLSWGIITGFENAHKYFEGKEWKKMNTYNWGEPVIFYKKIMLS